jgi:hypothetical protein
MKASKLEKKMNRSFFAVAAVIGAAALAMTSSADARTVRHYRHALTGVYGYAGPIYPRAVIGAYGAYGYAFPNRAYTRPGPPITVYGAEHYTRRAPQSDLNPDFQLGANR